MASRTQLRRTKRRRVDLSALNVSLAFLPALLAVALAIPSAPGIGFCAGGALAATSRVGGSASGGSAASEAGRWIDRPEDMVQFWINDVDRLGDAVRILYSTSPSLQQGQSGDWTANVYVVELSSGGEVSQHRVYSKKALEQVGLGLRRGHEEFLLESNAGNQGGGMLLEVRSTGDGSVVSSIDVPSPEGPEGGRCDWGAFKTPTTDGNVLFATSQSAKGTAGSLIAKAAWFVLSTDGEIVSSGDYGPENEKVTITGWLTAKDGTAGLCVDVSAGGESGLSGDADFPVKREVGGRTIEAVAASEKRLVTTGADGKVAWVSPALERTLIWAGDVAIPQDLPPQEIMDQNTKQMSTMEKTEIEYGARRTLLTMSRGRMRADLIKPTEAGYGALARVTANRRLDPPVHGAYYLEAIPGEEALRAVYLNPLAEERGLELVDFAPGEGSDIYVLGEDTRSSQALSGQVLRLAKDGSVGASATISVPGIYGVELDGMIGAPSGAWIFGHGRTDDSSKVRLWVKRVSFEN
jgi:hypothetical protein